MDNCLGFEFFVKYDGVDHNPNWEEGDCTPQS